MLRSWKNREEVFYMFNFRTNQMLFTIIFALNIGVVQSVEGGIKEGLDAYNKHDYATALKEFRPLAERGNVKAQNNLAKMYRIGQGVPRNYKKAAKWYRRSSYHGDANGQFALAEMYFKGQGVFKNYRKAVVLLRKAAEQGHSQAKLDLSILVYHNKGIPKNYIGKYK